MDSGIARGRVRTTATPLVNHGQRIARGRVRTTANNGGVAQDGGHKGTSKPKGGLIFRVLSGAQRGYTIC